MQIVTDWWMVGATLVGAVIVAVCTWRVHHIVERRRLTYDTILRKYWDVDYVIARKRLNEYRKDLKRLRNLEEFFNPPNHDDNPKYFRKNVFAKPREFISVILNDYELLSIGIANGVIDERIVKSLMYGSVMSDWMTFARFIRLLRDESANPRIYIEFEKLYERWKVNPPNPKRSFGKFRKVPFWE